MRKITIVTTQQNTRPTWNSSATTWGDLKNEFDINGVEFNSDIKALLRGENPAAGDGNIELSSDNITLPNRDIIILFVVSKVKSGMSYLHLSVKNLKSVCQKRGIAYETADSPETLEARLLNYDEVFGITSENPYAALVTAANLSLVKTMDGSLVVETVVNEDIPAPAVEETVEVEDDLDRELREAEENQ